MSALARWAIAAICGLLPTLACAAPVQLRWGVTGTTNNGVVTGALGSVIVNDGAYMVSSVFSRDSIGSHNYSVVVLHKKGDSGCRTVHTALMDTTEKICVTLVERADDGLTIRTDRRTTFTAKGKPGKFHETTEVALKFDASTCTVQLMDASRTFMDTGDTLYPMESVRSQTCTLEAQK